MSFILTMLTRRSVASPSIHSIPIRTCRLTSLLDAILHFLLRIVVFVRQTLRLHPAHHLLEHFHCFKTSFAFVTLHLQFDGSVRSDGDFKFPLTHSSILPVAHL